MKKEKTIAFRLDANDKVASGHMIRCISIAKECIKSGNKCIFFLSENSISDPIEAAGIPFKKLNLKWDNWDYGTESLLRALKDHAVDYLVVDSYLVTAHFFEEMAKEIRVFYLDDLCKEQYKVDATLHYSEWEDDSTISDLYKGTDAKVFSGMKYVPLREEFRIETGNTNRKYDLLITTGGTDKYHLTKGLVERILADSKLKNLSLCVVCGMMNTDYDDIVRMCADSGNVEIFRNAKNMSELMQMSKCAITAGGVTVYELMASGTFFFVFSFSDDQTLFGKKLKEHGNSVFVGDMRYEGDSVIDKILAELDNYLKMSEQEKDRILSNNKGIVDGNGSVRIAELLDELI